MRLIGEKEVAILGLLKADSLYGYEIEKIIEDRNMRHWTKMGFSSIYYILNKLEQKKLVKSTIKHSTGKPSRRIYTITSTGRNELVKKLKDVLSINTKSISPFELGIAYIDILDFSDALQCLDQYIESLEIRKERLKLMLHSARESNSNHHTIALFERPLELVKAEEKWIKKYVNEFKNLKENKK
ncbi:MAG: helix-turn-helix transcriptional regulator [Candidatus Heimdallarchaeota archaeon]|nr:helix-turn-helix transcriptional regulator [Candidatus Heimdallarchaeota archaeon]